MFKKITILIFTCFYLFGCTQQRDIFNEEVAKSFKTKDIESPFFGDSNAKVQLVIYSDFQCPACIRFENTIGLKLLNEYALINKIGLTYKNYPLNTHKNAPEDALAAMCAHEQDKYKDFAVNMYKIEEEKDGLILTTEDRQGIATKSGLDLDKFNQCMFEGRYVEKIKKDMVEGDQIGLEGTPSAYVNGTLLEYTNKEDFFKIIDGLIQSK